MASEIMYWIMMNIELIVLKCMQLLVVAAKFEKTEFKKCSMRTADEYGSTVSREIFLP